MRSHDQPLPQPPRDDRPENTWMCGGCNLEAKCQTGPTPRGACAAPDMKCRPVRTWVGKRRLARNAIWAFAVGLLCMALSGPWQREFIAPGPLATPHAQLLQGVLHQDRCAACHPAAKQGIANWFSSAGDGHQNVTQSQLCIDCHHATIPRSRAELAHNLTTAELRLVSQDNGVGKRTWHDALPRPGFDADAIACSVCHREHQGATASLSHLTNTQCQTCHQDRFASFVQGHPDWVDWPYGRGGTIAFNHASHELQHFNKEGRAFTCQQCHSVTAHGEITRTEGYETACASCHDKSLKLQVAEGFDLLALPVLDWQAVREQGGVQATWPEDADGVEPFRLAPLTRLLLIKQPEVSEALDLLVPGGDVAWNRQPSAASIAATAHVATELRSLFQSLAQDPVATLTQRIESPVSPELVQQLPPQLVAGAFERWFIEANGKVVEGNGDAEQTITSSLPESGWYRDDNRMAIRYRANSHADPGFQRLIEFAHAPQLDEQVRQELLEIPGAAACIECHSVSEEKGIWAWRALPFVGRRDNFTRFSHAPHRNIQALADCRYCHQVGKSRSGDNVITRLASTREVAGHQEAVDVFDDFLPMTKSQCSECHTPQAAGDSCVKCHRYHVGQQKLTK